MIFGFKLVNKDNAASSFLGMMAYSIKQPFNIVTSPYEKKRLVRVGEIWVLQIVPSWWRLDLMGLFLYCVAVLFQSPLWLLWLLAIVTVVLSCFFYPPIYMLGLRLGLLKQGSKAKVVFLSTRELAEVLAFGSD